MDFKKLACLFIICVMLFASACQAEQDTVEEEIVEEVKIDLEGQEFSIAVDQNPEGIVLGYELDTTLADLVTERIKNVEIGLNCEIPIFQTTDFAAYMQQEMAIGDSTVDITFVDASPFRDAIKGELLVPVDDYMNVIDINDSFRWGTLKSLELLMHNGKIYGLLPASWVGVTPPYYCFIVTNNNILKQYNYNDPREYLENKSWSRDIMMDIVKTCTDTEIKQYGMETRKMFWYQLNMLANDVTNVVYVDGVAQSGYLSDKAINGLSWAQQEWNEKDGYFFNDQKEDNLNFMNGLASMVITNPSRLFGKIVYAEAVTDFSLMPIPNGPDAEYGDWSGFFSTGTVTLGISASTEDVEQTATVMNEVFAPLEGYETQEKLFDYYSTYVLHDPRDIKLLYSLLENAEYNYWKEGGGDVIIGPISDSNKSPAESMLSYSDVLNSVMNEFILPNVEGMANYQD